MIDAQSAVTYRASSTNCTRLPPESSATSRYQLHPATSRWDDLPLFQQVFPSAKRHVLQGTLVFNTPEPALRFYATNRIDALLNRPNDASHHARLLPVLRERIEAIINKKGAFVVSKSVGFFVAEA